MLYYSTNNQRYETEKMLGRGGEAQIYSIKNHPDLVAKIFHDDKRNTARRKKAHIMSQLTVSDYFRDSVALPVAVLYEDSEMKNKFAGYIMPFVRNITELQNVYYYNNLNYKQKVRIAQNLCIMTNLVHAANQTIGDFNPRNIAIDSNKGTGVLIDTDSFHITVKNSQGKTQTFPCTVGVEALIAPELRQALKKQKATLETIQGESFNQQTDLYALAFHIFALLMNGSTPYRAAVNLCELGSSHTISDVTIDMFEAANEGEFLFAKKVWGKKLPEDVPDFNILSPKLKELFTRCFIDGAKKPDKRPTAKEFYSALEEYYNMLEKRPCGHYHRKGYRKPCEFCRVKKFLQE